jgi:hypothetical protein
MEDSLNSFRKKLEEIEDFPCKSSKKLLDTIVFHFESWSEKKDKEKGISSTSKVDVVLEVFNGIIIVAIEYKEFLPRNRKNKPYKVSNIGDDNLEKVANHYAERIARKFKAFCNDYTLLWPNVNRKICFVLLSPTKERYEDYFKELVQLSFSDILKELSREKKAHEFNLRAKIIKAFEKLLELTQEKVKRTLQGISCCEDVHVGECEKLERIVIAFTTNVEEKY